MPGNRDELRPDTPRTLVLCRAQAYWEEKRAGRAMPSRADLDPVDIPDLLPFIILIDIVPPESRLRIRLAGTEVCNRFGMDYTGRFLDEIDFGDVREKILADYGHAARSSAPCFTAHRFRKSDRDFYYNIERGIFPLSSDGEKPDKLLAVLDFEPTDEYEC